jgi:N-acyl-L-homoserine lactone synthetase
MGWESLSTGRLFYRLPQLRKVAILFGRGSRSISRTTLSPFSFPYSDVSISKGVLVGRVLAGPEEARLAQRLRYRVFVDKLKWVSGQDGLDIDEYDNGAISFGVFEGGILRGTLRVILPHQPFMLEKAFKDLLRDHCLLKTPDVIEVSRLATDPDMTDSRQKQRTLFLLHYLLYLWMDRSRMRYLYLVSTHKLIASLRRTRGVSVKTFGREGKTHNNMSYQAALIDMREIMDWRSKTKYLLQYFFI